MTNVNLTVEHSDGKVLDMNIESDDIATPNPLLVLRDLAKVSTRMLAALHLDPEAFILSVRREHDRALKEGARAVALHARQFPVVPEGTPAPRPPMNVPPFTAPVIGGSVSREGNVTVINTHKAEDKK